MSTSITTTKMSEELQSQSSRYQQLKQRKDALEKKLNEKYEQLHQICQKVSVISGLMSNAHSWNFPSLVVFYF
jgi:flagellar capping protein FliD